MTSRWLRVLRIMLMQDISDAPPADLRKVFVAKVDKVEVLQDLVDKGIISIVHKADGSPVTKDEIAQLALTGSSKPTMETS